MPEKCNDPGGAGLVPRPGRKYPSQIGNTMKTPNTERLLAEFPDISKAQWKEAVIAELKGAEFDKKLLWSTPEGFRVEPYYERADLKGLEYLQHYASSFINLIDASAGPRTWVNREKIAVGHDIAQANRIALDALNRGADGLAFDITGRDEVDLRALLNHILPLHCSLSFIADRNAARLIKGYFTYESEQHIDNRELFGSLNYDPLRNLSLYGKMAGDAFDILKEIIQITDRADRFFGLTVNSSPFANSGATAVQELAFVLNMAVEYLDRLSEKGLDPAVTMRNMEFSMSIGTHYFMEIAKLRALRILFYQVASAYGQSGYNPGSLSIHSQSSIWTKTVFDPYVNMLRNTTEAMSAIIGGCNSITIAPFDESFGAPGDFSRRISRNVSTILKEESYFDKVVDPSAGSYYIERLTDQLVEHAWQLFSEVEAAGGYSRAFGEGLIQKKVREMREQKLQRISQRRDSIVGTNQYPNSGEKLDPDAILWPQSPSDAPVEVLKPMRATMELEALRLDTEVYVKKNGEASRPRVYLALIGQNAAMRTARAGFSAGFLGCAGFAVTEGPIPASPEDAVSKALEANAQVTVICGADADYAEEGLAFARSYRHAKKGGLLLIAGYPADAVETLRSAGVDEFIHIKADLIGTLRHFQTKLNLI
jgi:methylmalonyl-CoA mutase